MLELLVILVTGLVLNVTDVMKINHPSIHPSIDISIHFLPPLARAGRRGLQAVLWS